MIAKPFELSDLDNMDLDLDLNDIDSKEDVIRLFNKADEQSVIVSFVEDEKIIAVSGIVHLYGDVGEAFNLRTKYLHARHIKGIRSHLHGVSKLFDRVQTVSKPEWHKWHRALGFEREAIMRKFMHGKDYDLWVIINGN